MKIFLLAGERTEPIGPLIRQLETYRLPVAVVISGHSADTLLRNSPELENCELIFDAHEDRSDWLYTNMRSGLFAAENESIIVPHHLTLPTREECLRLARVNYDRRLDRQTHLIRSAHGFPLLVTREGRDFIKYFDDLKGFNDRRLLVTELASFTLNI